MKSPTLFGVLLAMTLGFALAQPANPFLGKWKVTWSGPTRELEAELVVTDSGGSWKLFASSAFDPCVGREVPIAIESLSAEDATIKLKFSEVVNGCPDLTVRLKRVDANTATGTRGKVAMSLTRK